MRSIEVVRPGLSTTVQDSGRRNTRSLGVPTGGAMDRVSHDLANSLVGNAPDAATLEMTLAGAELRWHFDSVIAVTGADMDPVACLCIDMTQGHEYRTEVVRVPTHRPVFVPAGTSIRFQSARQGARCYLAVAGGIDVPIVLGSRSTLLTAEFGGHHGRRLISGDSLPVGNAAIEARAAMRCDHQRSIYSPKWFVRTIELPTTDASTPCPIRIVFGSHFDDLSAESKILLTIRNFQVAPQSDRMGFRLIGDRMNLRQPNEMQSEGTTFGTIQLPPDGQPIVLMADSAPTGGYPRIAHVISADLPTLAQLRPGQYVRFQLVTLAEAQRLLAQQQVAVKRALAMVRLLQR